MIHPFEGILESDGRDENIVPAIAFIGPIADKRNRRTLCGCLSTFSKPPRTTPFR